MQPSKIEDQAPTSAENILSNSTPVISSPAPMSYSAPPPVAPIAQNTPAVNSNQQPVGFTSNPFIAFGQAMGGALRLNPLWVIGYSFLFVTVSTAVYYFPSLINTVVPGYNPNLGVGLATLLFIPIITLLLWSFVMAKSALLYTNSSDNIKSTTTNSKVTVTMVLHIAIYEVFAMSAIFAGLLLFVIPGIFLYARLSLGVIAIVKEGVGPPAAFSRSWHLTGKNTWNMLGVATVQSVVHLLNLFFYTGSISGFAHRYTELKKLEARNITNTTTHWSNYLVVILNLVLGMLFVIGVIMLLLWLFTLFIDGLNGLAEQEASSNSKFYLEDETLQTQFN